MEHETDCEFEFTTWAELLTGEKDPVLTWQVFEDKKERATFPYIRHCRRSDISVELASSQEMGCGIFATVNEMNGHGRESKNLSKVRVVWCDIDGDEPDGYPLEPTMVVRTRNGFHVYYVLIGGCSASQCVSVNRAIASALGGDPASVDVSRVLRVPGYYHLKGEPFMVSVMSDGGCLYTIEQVMDVFGSVEKEPVKADRVSSHGDTPVGLSAAMGEYKRLAQQGVGGRNKALCQSSFRLGQMIASGDLTEGIARVYLRKGVTENGYLAEEGLEHVEYVIGSGITAGRGAPREVESTAASEGQIVVCKTIEQIFPDVSAILKKRLETGCSPVKTPLPSLNHILGGGAFMGGATVLGAPPGAGKSTFCLQWCEEASRSGTPVIYASLELSHLDLITRLCTMRGNLSWIDARSGKGLDRMSKIIDEEYSGLPFYSLDRNGCSKVELLSNSVKYVSDKHGKPPLVIVDYVQLLCNPEKSDGMRVEMNRVSSGLRMMAQETMSALVCISAVGRASYNIIDPKTRKPNRMMALSAAKESGSLEYDSEAMLGMQLFDGESGDNYQYGWICVAKNRSGNGTGDVAIKYHGESGLFFERDGSELSCLSHNDTRECIFEIIGSDMMTKTDIANKVNKRRQDVLREIDKMMDDGLIEYEEFSKKYKLVKQEGE